MEPHLTLMLQDCARVPLASWRAISCFVRSVSHPIPFHPVSRSLRTRQPHTRLASRLFELAAQRQRPLAAHCVAPGPLHRGHGSMACRRAERQVCRGAAGPSGLSRQIESKARACLSWEGEGDARNRCSAECAALVFCSLSYFHAHHHHERRGRRSAVLAWAGES